MDLELLRERAGIIRKLRSFFDIRDYLETDTPLLAPDLIPESCLEVFETVRLPPEGSRRVSKTSRHDSGMRSGARRGVSVSR